MNFSTAVLIPRAAVAVRMPRRNTEAHFTATYCKISLFFLERQSCLNISFSTSLQRIQAAPEFSKGIAIAPHKT
jgi:hypothetical protein